MNKQQLANKIWESANKMRSKIEANEYKDYILGFIFYKYLSDKEVRWLKERDYEDDDIREYVNENDSETVKNAQENLGYFIAYKDLFSTWINMGADFSVDNVRTALSSFTRLISKAHKKVFDGIFNTLETGLSKLGDNTKSQTKAISDLIHLIKDIPMDGKQDYDVLGFIYEYLISMFAANAGKKAGEFYTPHEVSVLMSEIIANYLRDRSEIKIYDPTSGSGSLLINIGHAVAKHMDDPNRIRYYAQELKQNTYNLTRMNLVMRGILPDNIVTRNGDTLEDDWPYFDESDPIGTYDPLYVDAVVSNPPYSQRWEPEGKENDPRYSRFGLAPKSKADYAFLLHDLYHLKPDGIMTIVLPHGVLFRGGEEGEIRKNLIENNHIDAIIGLPANIFFGTGIPTIIMVLRQKRENTDVLIVDASKGFEKVGKNNQLRACDIRKIVDVVNGRLEIEKYSKKISREEIRENDYNLNIPRYVDSSEEGENWDIYSLMFGGIPDCELQKLNVYWQAFPTLKEELFQFNGKYAEIAVNDIKRTIADNADVKRFRYTYNAAFDGFGQSLRQKLIDNAENVKVVRIQEEITNDIFKRLKDIDLIDKYEAYELLVENWSTISADLEMIQTEGFSAVKTVDPNMVVKKKKDKEEEVQDGWKGHILPFELVQDKLLVEENSLIKAKNNRLSEIQSEYEEILEELTDDDKEQLGDAVSEEGDSFVIKNFKNVIKELKAVGAEDTRTLIEKLNQVDKLNREEKALKSDIKEEQDKLVLVTKEKIESLSDEDAKDLLYEKWIAPVLSGLNKLPENIVNALSAQIQTLADKYSDTYADIEEEIVNTEKSLSEMLSQLSGSDSDMKGILEFQKLIGGDLHE